VITDDGWVRHCIWEYSSAVRDLYARRCRLEEEEMTCAAQAAELLAPHASAGDILLDVGCGSGYLFHSLRKRDIPVEYFGIDASPALIGIGQKYMPAFGLPADNLKVLRVEDLYASVDHVICMNVLSNIDNYHRPLERMLQSAAKTMIIRESCQEKSQYSYVRDDYLDPGCNLKVHVNAYSISEIMKFIESYGFRTQQVVDRRTGGKAEMVIGYPHYWTFFMAVRGDAPVSLQ